MSGGPAHVSLWTGCHFEDKLRGGHWWVGRVGGWGESVSVSVCWRERETQREKKTKKKKTLSLCVFLLWDHWYLWVESCRAT